MSEIKGYLAEIINQVRIFHPECLRPNSHARVSAMWVSPVYTRDDIPDGVGTVCAVCHRSVLPRRHKQSQ